ncbi:efflux RND transporter permease subunit [Pseudoalteromonas sp. CnMc7-15]|uniref:efflux RND transporter permease subunit n=1 Tax=unclassified Pseudoalteromonas TaxID=194690 RepID=UPI001EF56155|nr:efflux RND transporter permease subunit [Pseudoalteromonas sp. CnMc7-15]MCG7564853.1 efflux RND transporter permease subunit [Pseudoalteromonas sp. CnMc7-15]
MSEQTSAHIQDLPSMAIRRPVLIVVLNLLIIIAGIAAIAGVEVRELPDVDRPRITVSASFPGGSPETVDTEVTSKLEGAVARVSGVKSIRAQSEEGSSRIVVEFRPGVNLDDAANETRESVARVQRELPEEVERVSIIKADNDAEAVVSLTVSSEALSLEALTERVETDLAPQFLTIPGVADVRLNGDRERVLRVRIDPLKLSSFNLTVPDVADALRQAPFDVPAGSLKSNDQQLIVRADATSVTAEQVGDIIVGDDTRIADIAAVYFGPADPRSMVRLDGQPVIGMEVIRQAQSNTIEISDEVLSLLTQMRERFPEMTFTLTSDDAQFIRSSVDEVLNSLVLTVILVVITLWVFIGSWRATLVPAFAIPVALVGSLALIWALGFSINILTLLALVLATGLIVDDAIVVSENIQRQRSLGLGRRAAAVVGTREVFFAVVATTAVLAAVFVPIAFLPSTAGKLFREFGGVLAGAVIISSFVALSLVPALTSKLKLKSDGKHVFGKVGHALANVYKWCIHKVLNHAWLTLIACALVAVASGALYSQLENELLPSEDRGKIRIFARGPDGVGLNFMDRQAKEMEDILLPYVESGEIESIYTVVGQWDPNITFITVPLKHWDERHFSQQEIINKIRGPLGDIPGAPARAFGSNSLNLRGQGGGVELALLGQDYEQIFIAAQQFAAEVEKAIPQVAPVRISYQPSQPQLRVNIDRRRAQELGVDLSDIAITLRAAINGDDVADLNVGDQSIPIMLQAQNRTINSPSDLANLYVGASNGELVPLSSVANISEEGVAAELERHAQRRAIEMDMELPPEMPMAQLVDQLRDLSQQHLPSGITLAFKGEALTFEETANEVLMTYVLAFVIVLLVLAAQFESVNSAVVVMITVPFGITSAILALYLTDTSLNIYSQIGLVMLIGLIAKNAILLVEFADQLRDRGHPVREAVERAALVRLRPIAMTLVSTLLGALPLILSTGAGAEARNAIGWVVFGGLALAVLFTLFLTPVIYLGLARFTSPRGDESKQLAQELEQAH